MQINTCEQIKRSRREISLKNIAGSIFFPHHFDKLLSAETEKKSNSPNIIFISPIISLTKKRDQKTSLLCVSFIPRQICKELNKKRGEMQIPFIEKRGY